MYSDRLRPYFFRVCVALAVFASCVVHIETRADYKAVKSNSVGKIAGADAVATAYVDELSDDAPAKICFTRAKQKTSTTCFEAKPAERQIFQGVTRLFTEPFRRSSAPRHIFILETYTTSAGLGESRYITLWHYGAESRNPVKIGEAFLSDLGAYAIIPQSGRTPPGFVTAERIWDFASESLDSPHRYLVEVYGYREKHLRRVGSFKTEKKYAPESEARVIEEHRSKVNLLLNRFSVSHR